MRTERYNMYLGRLQPQTPLSQIGRAKPLFQLKSPTATYQLMVARRFCSKISINNTSQKTSEMLQHKK
jgi:hypothetical protein